MPSADAAIASLPQAAGPTGPGAVPLDPVPAADSSVDLRKLLIIFAVMLGTLLEIIDSSIEFIGSSDRPDAGRSFRGQIDPPHASSLRQPVSPGRIAAV